MPGISSMKLKAISSVNWENYQLNQCWFFSFEPILFNDGRDPLVVLL